MKKVLLIILSIVALMSCDYTNERKVTVTVTGKERIHQSEGNGYYLIFTDSETFKISDQIFFGKFNSSDIYGSIKEGEIYTFKVYGYRIPIASEYPNIRKIIN